MKLLVADSSSLILLTKTGVLQTLLEVATVIVPEAVFNEVCAPGHVHKHVDAGVVLELVEHGRLETKAVVTARPLPVSLGLGERDAIQLFFQEDADAVLTDDGRAIKACKLLAVPYIPTPRLVVDLCRSHRLSFDAAGDALEQLAFFGRYAPDVIASAFARLNTVRSLP